VISYKAFLIRFWEEEYKPQTTGAQMFAGLRSNVISFLCLNLRTFDCGGGNIFLSGEEGVRTGTQSRQVSVLKIPNFKTNILSICSPHSHKSGVFRLGYQYRASKHKNLWVRTFKLLSKIILFSQVPTPRSCLPGAAPLLLRHWSQNQSEIP